MSAAVGSAVVGVARRTSRVLLAVLAIAAMLPASSVSAHATILESSPADGTLLTEAPDTLTVRFSEPIRSDFIDVRFLSTSLDTAPLMGSLDPNDPSVLIVPLPPMGDGLHQIAFQVRDREDLHEVRGRTSFAVGKNAVAIPSAPSNPAAQPFETTARWMFAIGLALLVGVVVTRTRHLTDVADEVTNRRLVGLTWLGGATVVLGRLGVLLARALDLGVGLGDGVSAVLKTSDAVRLPITLAALACTLPACLPKLVPSLDATVRDGGKLTIRALLGWVGIVWLAVITAWGDHAALLGAVEPAVALAKTAHFIGLGLWIGLLVVTLVVQRGTGRMSRAFADISDTAMAGAIVAVSSGLLLGSRMVVSLTGMFATVFGQLLSVKVALVAVAVVLGLAHRKGHRPRIAAAEAGVLILGVVVLGAAMATAGPATDDAYRAAPTEIQVKSATAELGDIIVRAQPIPAVPGANDLDLLIVQTRRPVLAPITTVLVTAHTASGAQEWTVVPDERGGAVVSGANLPDGPTTFAFAVSREDVPVENLSLTVSTRTPRYFHPEIVSSARLVWVLRIGAVLAALLLVPLILGHRRRSTPPSAPPR